MQNTQKVAQRHVPQQHRAYKQPHLLVLGHVCRDMIAQTQRLGGAAAFAAHAAATLGIKTAVVTCAPRTFSLMQPLQTHPNITLYAAPCQYETTFRLAYHGSLRHLTLSQKAPDLATEAVPPHCRQAKIAYVAPIIGECHRPLVATLKSNWIVVGAQGWLRAVDAQGRLQPTLAPEICSPPANVYAFVFSECDHPEAEILSQQLAAAGKIVALTRGAAGLTLYTPHWAQDIKAYAAIERDPTGAGDVFGVVFALALEQGMSLIAAAKQGAQAAARVVEGPGLGRLSEYVKTLDPASLNCALA